MKKEQPKPLEVENLEDFLDRIMSTIPTHSTFGFNALHFEEKFNSPTHDRHYITSALDKIINDGYIIKSASSKDKIGFGQIKYFITYEGRLFLNKNSCILKNRPYKRGKLIANSVAIAKTSAIIANALAIIWLTYLSVFGDKC